MRHLKTLPFSKAVVLISAFAAGQGTAMAATIKQMVSSDNYAFVVLTPEEQAMKPFYLLATKEGKQCRLSVVLNKEHLVKVSTKDCPFKDQLAIGEVLELPLINEEIVDTKQAVITSSPVNEVPAKADVALINRNITDLQYLPYEGGSQFTLTGSTREQSQTATINGSIYATANDSYNAIDLSYIYGISDHLSLGIAEEILISSERDYFYGPASGSDGQHPTLGSDGVGDPILAMLFRGVEQSEKSAVSLDILAGYLTKLQDAKSATKDEIGNAARGGDGFIGQLTLSRKFGIQSIKASLTHTAFNKRSSSSDSQKVETTGGNTMNTEVRYQFRGSDPFAVGASVGYTSVNSSDQTGGPLPIGISSYSYMNIGLNMKYVLIPNILYSELGIVHYNAISQSISSSATKVNSDISASNKLSLGLNFVF